MAPARTRGCSSWAAATASRPARSCATRDVASVDVVELDPAVVRPGPPRPGAVRAQRRTPTGDPRVRVATADAFAWLRGAARASYDVVICRSARPRHHPEHQAATRRSSTAWSAGSWPPGPSRRARGAGLRPAPGLLDGGGDDAHGGTAHHPLPRRRPRLRLRRGPRPHGRRLRAPRATGASCSPHREHARLWSRRARGPRPVTLTREPCRRRGARAEATRIVGLPASTLMHPRLLETEGGGRLRARRGRTDASARWVGSATMEHEVFVPVPVEPAEGGPGRPRSGRPGGSRDSSRTPTRTPGRSPAG